MNYGLRKSSGSSAILLAILRAASSLLSNLCFYLFRHFAPGPSHFLHYFPMRFRFSLRNQTVTLGSKLAILIRCFHLEIPRLPHQLRQLGDIRRNPLGLLGALLYLGSCL